MKNIEINDKGKYIWGYELNLLKNFVVFKLVMKIIVLSLFCVYVLSCLLSFNNVDFFFNGLLENTKLFIILTAVLLALTLIAYFIYAKIMNGKYCVVFEMDENGIKHTQLDSQVDKANMLSLIESLVGAATKDPTLMGSGLTKYGRTSIYTDFKKVKRIKTDRNSNAIILTNGLHNNQIYIEDDDYDEVLKFINNNCSLSK